MPPGRVEQRLAALEAAASRLLAQELAEFGLGLQWLTFNELAALERWLEGLEAGATIDELPGEFRQRAIGRALLGVDMAELDRREREGERLLRIPHPDRPDDPLGKLYIVATEDPLAPGRWYLDGWYVRQWPKSLPSELTTADVERLSVGPARRAGATEP